MERLPHAGKGEEPIRRRGPPLAHHHPEDRMLAQPLQDAVTGLNGTRRGPIPREPSPAPLGGPALPSIRDQAIVKIYTLGQSL